MRACTRRHLTLRQIKGQVPGLKLNKLVLEGDVLSMQTRLTMLHNMQEIGAKGKGTEKGPAKKAKGNCKAGGGGVYILPLTRLKVHSFRVHKP